MPQVHQPDQRDGEIAKLPLFPNVARKRDSYSRILGLEASLKIARQQIVLLTQQLVVFQRAAEKFPFPYEIAEFSTRLTLEPDGSALITRDCLGITSSHAVSRLEIPYELTLSQGELGAVTVEPHRASKLKPAWDGVVKGAQASGVIRIDGEVSANTGFVGFSVSQRSTRGFLATREEVEANYSESAWPGEYFGSSVFVPVKVLRVTVDFPPEFGDAAHEAEPVVFFGNSEVENEMEGERVDREGSFIAGRTSTLTIQNPRRGNEYVIAWMPPAANAGERGT
jgi:hypothetical protein